MAIYEMELVLSSLDYPNIDLPEVSRIFHFNPSRKFQLAKSQVKVDVVTRDIFPKRKENALLSKSFIELGRFTRGFNMANRSDMNLRLARIHNEIRNSGAKPHPHYDIYICESDFCFGRLSCRVSANVDLLYLSFSLT